MLSPQQCEQARLSRDPRFDGLFFVLVNTTKIFCRNTCKVRLPLEKNVSYAASAQQALVQGYRPCLRCRPDSAPNSSAWQGVNTTVSRAISLLNEHFDVSIESLAARLGITPRYLNKLFQQHLQLSAKRYRIYQQVLMAKSLLQQTQLSIEQVAQSVGFSSARQLQQHVSTHLRLTPSQIRKNAQLEEVNAICVDDPKMPEVRLLLSYRPPYNWIQVREFFARREITGNESVTETGLSKILSIGEQAVKVDLVHMPQLHGFYLSFNAAYSKETLKIVAIVRRMLDLDAHGQLIEQALLNAGLAATELVEGLRIPGVASEFEAGCRAILGQQVSVTAAVNKVNQLHAYFADKNNKSLQTAFPTPLDVANDDLLFLKMPAMRRQTLRDLAAHYAQRTISNQQPQAAQQLENHKQSISDNHNDVSELISIKGIGPWTVSYIQLRALGSADVWLDTDLVIKQQAAKLIAQGSMLTPERAQPWRSYLTLNLWSLSA